MKPKCRKPKNQFLECACGDAVHIEIARDRVNFKPYCRGCANEILKGVISLVPPGPGCKHCDTGGGKRVLRGTKSLT